MTEQTATEDTLVYLDPTKVLADDNIRFGTLKTQRKEALKQSILEHGGIMVPVEVEELTANKNGFTHRLRLGFYRHAALLELNSEQGDTGLLLPAIVRTIDDNDRAKRQIAENNDRENLSPMDKSIAIKKLVDAGVEKGEIRRIFSSSGGRKGDKMQPMSNAMLNIHLRFLELPKTIQEKVHDGRVGVEGAYMLGRVPPDKRAAVLERAEKDRADFEDMIAKDEEKYLAAESKVAEANDKVKTAVTEVEQGKKDVVAGEALVKAATTAYNDEKKRILTMEGPAQASDQESLKAKEADQKGAWKVLKEAQARLTKALGQVKSAEEVAEEHKAKLEAARKAVKPAKKAKGIGKVDVEKAAKKEGVAGGIVPLSLSDFRLSLRDAMKEGTPVKVAQIAKVVRDTLDSKITTKEMIHDLGVITGEVKEPPTAVQTAQAAKAAKPKAAK